MSLMCWCDAMVTINVLVTELVQLTKPAFKFHAAPPASNSFLCLCLSDSSSVQISCVPVRGLFSTSEAAQNSVIGEFFPWTC